MTTPNGARDGMVFGTPRSRLAMAVENAGEPEDEYTFDESDDSLSYLRGLENPYGSGLSAYEPNTVLWDGGYRNAYNAVERSKRDEAARATSTTTVDFSKGTPLGDATGQLGAAINAAMDLANRRVPYVWGGTSRTGVDCSGLIQYAFRAAGIKLDGKEWPRFRAIDYGKMGQEVTLGEARAGDLVYIDNANTTTDHVGIYLGNGKMVQAPQTGDVVRVTNIGKYTSIRRVVDDGAFVQVATPEGGSYYQYGSQSTTWADAAVTSTPAPATIRRTGGFDRRLFA